MSNDIYIHDDFGNRIPLLDTYGNLSIEVIMLYSEDKLTAADRKAVDDFAAADEMSRDALDGYSLTSNSSKTRYELGQVNAGIQKISGAKAVATFSAPKNEFDYRKLAAAITLLVIVAGGTYFGSLYFGDHELADNSVVNEEPIRRNDVVREYSPRTVLSDSVGLKDSDDEIAETGNVLAKELAADDLKSLEVEQPVEIMEVAEAEFDLSNTLSNNQTEPEMTEARTESDSESVVGNIERELDAIQDGQIQGSSQDKMDVAAVEENKDLDNAERARLQQELERFERLAAATQEEESAKQASEKQALQAADMAMADMEDTRLEESVVIENQRSSSAKKAKQSAYESQEVNARYPGGDLEMYKYIENSKQYTDAMIEQGLKGAVMVSFQIDKNGKVFKAKVESGQTGLLAQDAIRVIESMPIWEPAKNANGNAIKSERVVTIRYEE